VYDVNAVGLNRFKPSRVATWANERRRGPETDVHVADVDDRHADAMGRVAAPV
jgi:hypothetical protein